MSTEIRYVTDTWHMPTINSGSLLTIIITLNFHLCYVHELHQLSKHIHYPVPSPGGFAAHIGLPAAIVLYSMTVTIRIRHLTLHLFLCMDPQFPQIKCSIRIMTRRRES